VYRFQKDSSNANSYNDDGQPIEAYWKSKPLTFGADERKKIVEDLFIGLKPSGRTSIDISYETNARKMDLSGLKDIKFNLFDFYNLDFNNFTFYFSPFPKEFKVKVKEKKVTHFQLTIKNDKLNEGLTILSLVIKYSYLSFIK
jgi:hypothetical protein